MLNDGVIKRAGTGDIPQLVELINSAYRGPKARQGWTHEADLIEGDIRIDHGELEKILNDPFAVILKFILNEKICGCVYLHQYDKVLYLGMLSVEPGSQNRGVGKKLLSAADEYAMMKKCSRIEMNVISKRTALIKWYEKHGYLDSGRKKPFHAHTKFGVPREPVEFMIMEKTL